MLANAEGITVRRAAVSPASRPARVVSTAQTVNLFQPVPTPVPRAVPGGSSGSSPTIPIVSSAPNPPVATPAPIGHILPPANPGNPPGQTWRDLFRWRR